MISKRVCILGSTGSIGCSTLEVIDNLYEKGYHVKLVSLTTNTRTDILSEQIKKYSPETVVITDKTAFESFISEYNFPGLEVLSGEDSLIEISGRTNYDLLITALVGFSGLKPTIKAIESGRDIALANKETMVVAGKLINRLLEKNNSRLTPIDSEHSALLQSISGENKEFISKYILTASGGPFRDRPAKEMKNISVKEALLHPNWKMGNKITIDSATMMNKGLEIIEAKWLFNTENDMIDVLIHPQSVIHSMVEFIDGSVKAQLGIPDMKIPIQYAITYPERVRSELSKMDFRKFSSLTFEEPDLNKFRCLRIAFDVMNSGGTYPVVMNAANEIAVDLFLTEKINFSKIPDIIEEQLESHNSDSGNDLDNMIYIDNETRNNIRKIYK